MKKILATILALISMMTASAFAEDKLSIVCTTFPQYDWVRQILGAHADVVELTLMLDNGIDLHNYQPTAADIAKISSSDLFIYVGGESDGWVNDVANGLKAAITPMDWVGLVLLCFVLPAVLSWVLNLGLRKLGWVKDGDMKLDV